MVSLILNELDRERHPKTALSQCHLGQFTTLYKFSELPERKYKVVD